MNNNYGVIKGFEKSRLYQEFAWKRFEKSVRLPLAAALLCWVAYMSILLINIPTLVTPIIITLN